MGFFTSTPEQKADQQIVSRLYANYFITMAVATIGFAIVKYTSGNPTLLKEKESSILFFSALTVFGGVAQLTKLSWTRIVLQATAMGIIVFLILWLLNITF